MTGTLEMRCSSTSWLVPALLAALLSGCSITGFAPEVDQNATTASLSEDISADDLDETVDPSDWDKIRAVMQTALSDPNNKNILPWQNDITGSIGTIVPMGVQSANNGTLCRRFSTTLNGVGGVLQYRGDACRAPNGEVELQDLKPYNAVVDATPSAGAPEPTQEVQ